MSVAGTQSLGPRRVNLRDEVPEWSDFRTTIGHDVRVVSELIFSRCRLEGVQQPSQEQEYKHPDYKDKRTTDSRLPEESHRCPTDVKNWETDRDIREDVVPPNEEFRLSYQRDEREKMFITIQKVLV